MLAKSRGYPLAAMVEEDAAPSAAAARGGRRFRPAVPALFAAILAAAAGLRFYELGGRSLWVDEISTAEAAGLHSLGALLADVPANRMPLDRVLAWSLHFLGEGDAAVRVPNAICGTLLVAAVFLLTRRLFGSKAGLVAAVAVAVSPFAIWYAQDASPYSLLMLLMTLQAWAAHRAAQFARLGDWLLFALLTALALYTHYDAVLVTIALFAYVAFELVRFGRRPSNRWRPVLTRVLGAATAGMLAVLALAPWAPAIRGFLVYQSVAAEVAGPSGADLASRLFWRFDGLAIWPLAVLIVLGLPLAARRAPILFFWLLIPLAGLLLILHGPLLDTPARYLAIIWPALAVLTGAGAGAVAGFAEQRFEIATAPVAAVLAAAVVLVSVPGLLQWSSEPKDDWRGAAAAVQADGSAGLVLTMGAGSDWAAGSIAHYLDQTDPGVPVFDAGGTSDNRAVTDNVAAAIGALPGAAWAVFASERGPSDLRAENRAATGVFTHPAGKPLGFSEIDLVGVTLLRGPDAKAVLDWASPFLPAVRATAALSEQKALAKVTLPPAAEKGPFHLDSTGPPADRTWTSPAAAATAMVARFQCKAATVTPASTCRRTMPVAPSSASTRTTAATSARAAPGRSPSPRRPGPSRSSSGSASRGAARATSRR